MDVLIKSRFDKLLNAVEKDRLNVVNHDIYASIRNNEDLKIFMQHHVYAVWDFMSLLKSLQNELTCNTLPWLPKGDAEVRYFINEIVVDEESDLNQNGSRSSHFEMYLDAMEEIGADTSAILNFLELIKSGETVHKAFEKIDIPATVCDLVSFTMNVAMNSSPHVKAAVFTFGREDLIPDMFLALIRDLTAHSSTDKFSSFKYYLERHIELDGGEHSNLAKKMTALLCGEDEQKWNEAEAAVKRALQLRSGLWDGVMEDLPT
jgi:hypothetical protein